MLPKNLKYGNKIESASANATSPIFSRKMVQMDMDHRKQSS